MGYPKGQFAVDWEQPYEFVALRRRRLVRASAALAPSRLRALLLWKNENARYIASLRSQRIGYKTSPLGRRPSATWAELPHVVTPLVASGEHMSPPHRIDADKIFWNGEPVFVDIGTMWNGYFCDVGRTTIVGRPTKEKRRISTAMYRRLVTGIEVTCPARTTAAMADVIVSQIEGHGLREQLFLGHSIGIGAKEPLHIDETPPEANVCETQSNMGFALGPPVWRRSRRRRPDRGYGARHPNIGTGAVARAIQGAAAPVSRP